MSVGYESSASSDAKFERANRRKGIAVCSSWKCHTCSSGLVDPNSRNGRPIDSASVTKMPETGLVSLNLGWTVPKAHAAAESVASASRAMWRMACLRVAAPRVISWA